MIIKINKNNINQKMMYLRHIDLLQQKDQWKILWFIINKEHIQLNKINKINKNKKNIQVKS